MAKKRKSSPERQPNEQGDRSGQVKQRGITRMVVQPDPEVLRRKKRVAMLKQVMLVGIPVSMLACIILLIICVVMGVQIFGLHRTTDQYEAQLADINAKYEELSQNVQENAETLSAYELAIREAGIDSEIWDTAISNQDGDTDEKLNKVYLTFDDGPSSETDQILDILKEYGVKATFFVIGKEDEVSKARYRRIVDEGHTLAMHTYTHKYADIYASLDSFKEDVLSLQSMLLEVTGYKPTLYRFPGGSGNTLASRTVSIQECVDFLDDEGITYFDWNVSCEDAVGGTPSADDLVKNAMEDMQYCNRAVVLMHDLTGRDATIEALPKLIDQIWELGASILPLTSEVEPIQQYTSVTRKENSSADITGDGLLQEDGTIGSAGDAGNTGDVDDTGDAGDTGDVDDAGDTGDTAE